MRKEFLKIEALADYHTKAEVARVKKWLLEIVNIDPKTPMPEVCSLNRECTLRDYCHPDGCYSLEWDLESVLIQIIFTPRIRYKIELIETKSDDLSNFQDIVDLIRKLQDSNEANKG